LFVVSEESHSELESDSASDRREVRSEYSEALSGVRVRKRTVSDFVTGEAGATDGIRLGATDGARLGATDGARLGATDGARLGATDGARLGGATGDTCLAVAIGIMSGRVSWAANFLGSIETDVIEV